LATDADFLYVKLKMEVRLVLGLILWSYGTQELWAGPDRYRNFTVYYSDSASASTLASYDLLVLDSDYHPDLNTLADRGKTLLGYLSLGEVERIRAYYDEVRAEGILLQENPFWKGSYFVDVRDPRWTSRVIERLIPRILGKGFQGLFLDTLDNPAYLEEKDPVRFRGMTSASATLVKTIRYHYPSIKIMLNRAYEILPEVETDIDIILGESVFTDYDFESKTYKTVPLGAYRRQVEVLKGSQRRIPKLQVMTLDYWDPNDREGVLRIYREQRKNGFVPYVATVELDKIVPEPKP
jgi:uncharacterized protein (TIGR01370 family)